MKDIKAKVGNIGARLKINGINWAVVVYLLADNTVLFVEDEEEFQKVVEEFYSVYTKRKLKVNARKSKVMVFERREVKMVDLNTFYKVSMPAVDRCEDVLRGEKLEEVKDFKYLGTVLYKHGQMEEVRGKIVKCRRIIRSLAKVMRRKNVSMEVKKGFRNSILLTTLTY